jgi:hypothetical protein
LRRCRALPPQPDDKTTDPSLTPMSETILVVNAGSSSIKFQLFEVGP